MAPLVQEPFTLLTRMSNEFQNISLQAAFSEEIAKIINNNLLGKGYPVVLRLLKRPCALLCESRTAAPTTLKINNLNL